MVLANINIALMASGLFWLFFFLVVFKTLKGKTTGGTIASSNAESMAASSANVGGINIHFHANGEISAGSGFAISPSNMDQIDGSSSVISLPADDPHVAALLTSLAPMIQLEQAKENETVVFS